MTNKRYERWRQAATDLGIKVIEPFNLKLSNQSCLSDALLVKDFGAKNGMIIVDDYKKIAKLEKELSSLGYGFSVLSPHGKYIKDSIIDILRDWSWTGSEISKPPWLSEIPDSRRINLGAGWTQVEFNSTNDFDSSALIELFSTTSIDMKIQQISACFSDGKGVKALNFDSVTELIEYFSDISYIFYGDFLFFEIEGNSLPPFPFEDDNNFDIIKSATLVIRALPSGYFHVFSQNPKIVNSISKNYEECRINR